MAQTLFSVDVMESVSSDKQKLFAYDTVRLHAQHKDYSQDIISKRIIMVIDSSPTLTRNVMLWITQE